MSAQIWTSYREEFPERHFKPSRFDERLDEILAQRSPIDALDVGGGVTGTVALKRKDVCAFLLDPYVEPPEWMNRFSWDDVGVFDLIVLRGSINYLSRDQIKKLVRMLDQNGVLLANTFFEPPVEDRKRPYISLTGEAGEESSSYDPETKIVHHVLTPTDSSKPIRTHDLQYYSPHEYNECMPGVQFSLYNTNSCLLEYRRCPGMCA